MSNKIIIENKMNLESYQWTSKPNRISTYKEGSDLCDEPVESLLNVAIVDILGLPATWSPGAVGFSWGVQRCDN